MILSQPALKLNYIWPLNFILIIFLVIFYFFQINSVTAGTYLVKNYNKKLQSLSHENKLLELNFFQSDSLENLKPLIEGLGLNSVEKIDYIELPESTVVIKPR